jgi:alanine racemase
MKRAAFARINLAHLKHNLSEIRKIANSSKIMAVVKADAYGHGMFEVCKCLTEADAFSVAYVSEAIELRESNIQQPIVALQGFSNVNDLKNAIAQNVQVVIHHEEQLNMLRSLSNTPTLNTLIKIDSGMKRLGFEPEVLPNVINQIQSIVSADSKIKLMTHLACADELDSDVTQQQLGKFDLTVKGLEFEQTIANSAGILAWPESHRDWVRPGLVLYGVNPIQPPQANNSVNICPVMSVYAPLISVKRCKKGEKIGYGGIFRCPRDMVIGVIAMGYADGYPRHLKSASKVLIRQQLAPVVGRVSMDMITVDITNLDLQVGEIVELWGETVAVSEVATCAETISYELLCAAGNALEKKYIQ